MPHKMHTVGIFRYPVAAYHDSNIAPDIAHVALEILRVCVCGELGDVSQKKVKKIT